MEFRILGTVAAVRDGQVVHLVRRKVRYLLGLLALEIGQPVPAERLASLLWTDRQPADVRAVLHTNVARLRAALADAAEVGLERHGDGYVLHADPDTVDAHRFRRLVEQARAAADPAERADTARRALALWRGPALADVAPPQVRDRLGAALDQARRQALDLRITAELDLGWHERLLSELADLNQAHPLDEHLTGHLMLALYRSGRRHEALEVYRQARQELADQLGLDPGRALRELEAAILRSAPSLHQDAAAPAAAPSEPAGPDPRRPAQLPAAIGEFTARRAELDLLDAQLAEPAAAVVYAVCGPGGVGKTALAVHWCHRVSAQFPDGQLYANLRGYDQREPVRPIEVLAMFLRALGVEAGRVPVDVEEASALYRTQLARRRMLVLLDNARSEEQVRPLLPGAPGCVAVVTSRDRLTGLIARDGARRLALEVLSAGDSAELLTRVLADRATGEPDAVAALAASCGGLPLALRIAAAQLADDPRRTIAEHVAELDRDLLTALRIEGDPASAVEATFRHSYTTLPGPARSLFRLLGLIPGPDFTAAAAAALAEIPVDAADRLIDLLVGAHLVEPSGPRRYALHDLLRVYARERATEDDPPARRTDALDRLYAFYLAHVDAAARMLYPQMLRLPPPAGERTAFADHPAARAWLDAERLNLHEAILHTADRGPAPIAWQLADAQRGYFWLTQDSVTWLAAAEAGLAAARTLGDLPAQAACHLSLGLAHVCVSRYPAADEHLRAALAFAEQAGWREGQAAALGSLGSLHLERGQLDPAAEAYRAALAVNTELGRAVAAATNRGNLGLVHMVRGRLSQAAQEFTEALDFHRAAAVLPSQALNLSNLGDVHRSLGAPEQALACLNEALALRRRLGTRQGEAVDLAIIAAVHRDTGRSDLALRTARDALQIMTGITDRSTEADIRTVHASIELQLGLHRQAVDGHTLALRLASEIGNRYQVAAATVGLAVAQHAYGMAAAARDSALHAVDLSRSGGYRVFEGQALDTLAAIELSRGRATEAEALAGEALAVHRETGHRLGAGRALTVLADAARSRGEHDEADRLRAEAHTLFAAVGATHLTG